MKLKNGMIVHCDTREKADKFLKECHKQGWRWSSGDALIDNDGVNNYYMLGIKGIIYHLNNNGLTCAHVPCSLQNKAISFEDLLEVEYKKKKCKVYTKHEYIHDNVKKVIVNEPCVIVILKTGEKGISKCHPEDIFNEELGYKIAYQRTQIQRAKLNLRMQELRLKYLIKHI